MTEPVYRSEGERWIPAPEAKGPFPGQHGGAVAGALAAAMGRHARSLEAGPGLTLSAASCARFRWSRSGSPCARSAGAAGSPCSAPT